MVFISYSLLSEEFWWDQETLRRDGREGGSGGDGNVQGPLGCSFQGCAQLRVSGDVKMLPEGPGVIGKVLKMTFTCFLYQAQRILGLVGVGQVDLGAQDSPAVVFRGPSDHVHSSSRALKLGGRARV